MHQITVTFYTSRIHRNIVQAQVVMIYIVHFRRKYNLWTISTYTCYQHQYFFSYFHNESKNHHPSLEELFRIISNRDLATRFETYPASQASEDNDVKLEVKNDDISHNISPFKSLLLNDMFLPIPRLGKRGLDLYF